LKKAPFFRLAYKCDQVGLADSIKLAASRDEENRKKFTRQIKWLNSWQMPDFPLKGQDLLDEGHKPGPQIADILEKLENSWIESDFSASKDDLMAELAEL